MPMSVKNAKISSENVSKSTSSKEPPSVNYCTTNGLLNAHLKLPRKKHYMPIMSNLNE